MAVSREFQDFIEELLAGFGPVQIKAMFGGAGVYADGINFGLIAEDTLYFKVDAGNRANFEAEGMSPFVYQGRGKPITMSYWQVPDRLLDDAGGYGRVGAQRLGGGKTIQAALSLARCIADRSIRWVCQ